MSDKHPDAVIAFTIKCDKTRTVWWAHGEELVPGLNLCSDSLAKVLADLIPAWAHLYKYAPQQVPPPPPPDPSDLVRSPTPRTDYAASLVQYAVVGEQYEVVTAEFARQLEREVAELREDAERYRWLHAHALGKTGPVAIWYRTENDSAWVSELEELDSVIDTALKGKP